MVMKLSSPLTVGFLALGSDRDVSLKPTAGKVNKSSLMLVSSLVSRLKSTYSKFNFIGIICSVSSWDVFVFDIVSKFSIFDSVRFWLFFNLFLCSSFSEPGGWVELDMELGDFDCSSRIG